jgi:hypothetical protein
MNEDEIGGHVARMAYKRRRCIGPLVGKPVDGRLGSRLRGYHPVAPRPLRYGRFVHRF